MTYENFIQYIKNPQSVEQDSVDKIKDFRKKYPYFHLSNWLYLKILKEQNSIFYNKELSKTSLHTSNRRNLYFYVFPEKMETKPRERVNHQTAFSGSYFDMIEQVENGNKSSENQKNSLKSLAQKLKEARQNLQMEKPASQKKVTDKPKVESDEKVENKIDNSHEKEQLVRQYIAENRYSDAIILLEELKNLNNSKKSVYFADQISFLKKIIENQ